MVSTYDKNIRRSITSKLNRRVAVVIAAIIFTATILISFLYTMTLITSTDMAAKGNTILLSHELGPALDSNLSHQQLQELMSHIQYLDNIVCLDLQDSHGQQLEDWERDPQHRQCHSHRILRDGITKFSGMVAYSRNDFTTPSGETYVLYIATDLSPSINNILYYMIWAYVYIFASILIGYILTMRSLRKLFTNPIMHLYNKLIQIKESHNLNHKIPIETDDEIGQLAVIINETNDEQYRILNDIIKVVDNLAKVNINLSGVGKIINTHSDTILTTTNEAVAKIESLSDQFLIMGQQMDSLTTQSEQGSTMISNMITANQQMNQSLTTMNEAVTTSINSIEDIAGVIKENNAHVDGLHNEAMTITKSLQKLDAIIAREERGAETSLELANQLSDDARNGYDSLRQTLDGIKKIQDSSKEVSDLISNLGRHALSIGSILNVIEDITNQTNLLSLNADIIAAQAGEHGRGFAVVSDEIGSLAKRTKDSTREISHLIETIQKVSKQASEAMQNDSFAIEEGARLGQMTAQAFDILQNSAKQAAEQAQVIAHATLDQANEVRSVTSAIKNITVAIDDINQASHKQANEATNLTASANQIQLLNLQVARLSAEQERSNEEVLGTIKNISAIAATASEQHQQQATSNKSTSVSVNSIEHSATHQKKASARLDVVTTSIDQLINQLSTYVDSNREN